MPFTKTAAIKFLNSLGNAVDIAVVDFDTEVRRRALRSERISARRRADPRAARRRATALYDAIGVYLDSASDQEGRKIMLLYTDGGDTVSSLSFKELIDLLKASDVTVIRSARLEHHRRPPWASAGHPPADRGAPAAGVLPAGRELDDAYEKVLTAIRAQYTVGYLSTNDKTDGAWRKVEIKVTRKDATTGHVRGRATSRPYKAARSPSGSVNPSRR